MRFIVLLIILLFISGCTRGYEIRESIKSEFPNSEVYQIEPSDNYRYLIVDSLGSIYLVKVDTFFNKFYIKSVTKIK